MNSTASEPDRTDRARQKRATSNSLSLLKVLSKTKQCRCFDKEKTRSLAVWTFGTVYLTGKNGANLKRKAAQRTRERENLWPQPEGQVWAVSTNKLSKWSSCLEMKNCDQNSLKRSRFKKEDLVMVSVPNCLLLRRWGVRKASKGETKLWNKFKNSESLSKITQNPAWRRMIRVDRKKTLNVVHNRWWLVGVVINRSLA